MTGAAEAMDLAVALVALVVGFVVGWVPLVPTAARVAGPGWAFLGLTADLAKGVIPVALGIVTVSWNVGWIAGIGAILGAAHAARAAGAAPVGTGRRAVATPAGVAIALAPPAGALSAALALVVVGVGRLVGRDARDAAIAVATVAYPLLFAAIQPDAGRLGGLLGLYAVVALVLLASQRRA